MQHTEETYADHLFYKLLGNYYSFSGAELQTEINA